MVVVRLLLLLLLLLLFSKIFFLNYSFDEIPSQRRDGGVGGAGGVELRGDIGDGGCYC